jgi:hypothetical protein
MIRLDLEPRLAGTLLVRPSVWAQAPRGPSSKTVAGLGRGSVAPRRSVLALAVLAQLDEPTTYDALYIWGDSEDETS